MKVSQETSSRSLSIDRMQEHTSRDSSSESAVDIAPHQQPQAIDPSLAALPRRPGMRLSGGASTSSGAGACVLQGEASSAPPSSVLGKRSAANVEDSTAARRLKKTSNEVTPIMRLLRSGGHRIDEQNNMVAYFVRQSPTQIDPEMLAQELDNRNPSNTLPALSQRVPSKISAKNKFPTNDFSRTLDRLIPTGEFTRAHDSVQGISRPRAYPLNRYSDAPESSRPLKKVGTYFEQLRRAYPESSLDSVELPEGVVLGIPAIIPGTGNVGHDHSYHIQSHAAYASRASQKPHGSPASADLPTSKVELWEFSVGTEEESGLPPEINDLQVCYPNSDAPRRIGDIGSVKLATTVDCHELGPKYLLFRAASSAAGRNPQAKRQLVVVGKGHQADPSLSLGQRSRLTGEIDLPALRVSFDSADGEVLGMQIGGPFFSVQDTRPTSTHYRKDGQEKHAIEVFNKNDNFLNPWNVLKKHAGTATPGKLKDVKFEHVCSVDKEVNNKSLAKILHDNKELSAWLAHDSGADVIYIRKRAKSYDLGDDAASMGNLLESLQNAGLIDDYDEIRVSTSRNPMIPDKPVQVRETYANAPRETEPIRTAELPMGSQNYLDRTLKNMMQAKEKIVDFIRNDPS